MAPDISVRLAGAESRSEGSSPRQVQAHLLRTAKMAGFDDLGKPKPKRRNWSVYFFFRVMADVEVNASLNALGEMLAEYGEDSDRIFEDATSSWSTHSGEKKPWWVLAMNYAQPSLAFGGKAEEAKSAGKIAHEGFRNWLNLLVHNDAPAKTKAAATATALLENLCGMTACADKAKTADEQAAIRAGGRSLARFLADRLGDADLWKEFDDGNADPETLLRRANGVGATLFQSDERAAGNPLIRLAVYEIMRQLSPALDPSGMPLIRGEADENQRFAEGVGSLQFDQCDKFDLSPVTFALSYSGLEALETNATTLASFPEPFREGMAARAAILKDIGPGAPENWEGVLGLKSVHGLFTGGSNLHGTPPASEHFWRTLRAEIRAFNDPIDAKGGELRIWLGLLFHSLGLEILHIELGQDPYAVTSEKRVERLDTQYEHFGFRDGLSQPFVDMGLGDPGPGGGTPSRQGTWTPIAPGEIFLDEKDEDGKSHRFPSNEKLRKDSTYLVFRKLEQDVHAFHAFLEQQRPGDQAAQDRLAAQFVGRWPDGTPLVQSPARSRPAAQRGDAALNDFLYAAEDPYGMKCPLGAHIRRANPRDTGGRNNVRRHRILRRGMAFGGRLLTRGEADNEPRGLLFVAACARIDLQFEVIQGQWLNGGEFLGQAGLGRCPLTGTASGDGVVRFLESGATAPVTGLPDFVTMRGGDYFFAPGIEALAAIAAGDKFDSVPDAGPRMGRTVTPTLFSRDRLRGYGARMLKMGERLIRVQSSATDGPLQPEPTAFVGRHDDVSEVLSNQSSDGKVAFSVSPYRDAGERLSRGHAFPVGTDEGDPTRERQFGVLARAWKTLAESPDYAEAGLDARISATAVAQLETALRRTAARRRLDLVEDLVVPAAYGVASQVLGLPGPKWFTELAVAIPFARAHIGDVPSDWLASVKRDTPGDPGLITTRIWMNIIVADLIGNVSDVRPLQAISRQAGLEALTHIDMKLAEAEGKAAMAAARKAAALAKHKAAEKQGLKKEAAAAAAEAEAAIFRPRNLVDAFVANAFDPKVLPDIRKFYVASTGGEGAVEKSWRTVYLRDAAIILLELLGATMTIIPLTFASVMETVLKYRIDLTSLLPNLGSKGVTRLVYEAERLNPNVGLRPRRCQERATLKSGVVIEEKDFVAAMIEVANLDEKVFPEPHVLSLGQECPELHGPKRNLEDYLLFGVNGSAKTCWGRDKVALPVLEASLRACGRLQGLRSVAGPTGDTRKELRIKVGLAARFTSVSPP